MARFDSLEARIQRVPAPVFDAALAIGVFMVSVGDLSVWISKQDIVDTRTHDNALAYILLAIAAGGIAIRRSNLPAAWLLSRAAVVTAVLVHTVYLEDIGAHIVIVVMVFTIAEQCTLPVAVAGMLVEYALVIAGSWSESDFGTPYLFVALFYFAGLIGLVWFAGRAVRRRRRLTIELERQTAELRKEQERLNTEAVVAERRRIAGELHGLVIQEIEQMALEARMARRDLAEDHADASEAIAAIEMTGRRSLEEMGRVLALMDAGPGTPPSHVILQSGGDA